MENSSGQQLFIYISGPYSAQQGKDDDAKKKEIDQNIKTANQTAMDIAKKGHIPLVPHTMLRGWEDQESVQRDRVLQICHKWLEKCDALYYIAKSEGTETERKVAVKRKLPIYRDLADIPEASPGLTPTLSSQAIEAYMTEYQQCAESYRHTYATIWQAGAIFAAASAAIVAFTASPVFTPSSASGTGSPVSIPWWIQVLAPMPLLFWWIGIFIPMNHYGELRNDRLVNIEKLLNNAIPNLNMAHFTTYSSSRKGNKADRVRYINIFGREQWIPSWFPRLRVRYVVSILGLLLIILEVMLIRKEWSQLSTFFGI